MSKDLHVVSTPENEAQKPVVEPLWSDDRIWDTVCYFDDPYLPGKMMREVRDEYEKERAQLLFEIYTLKGALKVQELLQE